jgi:hypothetical protein
MEDRYIPVFPWKRIAAMPHLTGKRLPKYRKHASGQALISLDGRDIYIGPCGSEASRLEYHRVVSEWLANGRMLPSQSSLSIN